MYTEDSNTGFLRSLKSLFATKKTEEQAHTMTIDEQPEALVEEYIPPVRTENVDAPTDKPMGTRTVDFSHIESDMAKSEAAIAETVHMEEDPKSMEDMDIQFASTLIGKGGKFIFCDTIADAVCEVKALAQDMGLGTCILLGKMR